jgi:hypothetical protein
MTALPVRAGADSPIDRLLSRLEGVKQTGADRWIARCPAHDDRRPSLGIRQTDDGRLLIHCWAGCSAAEIVHGAGLELADLFPERPEHHRPAERKPWRDAGLEALRALTDEANVTFVTACLVAGGIELTDAELDRMTLAAERCNAAVALLEGGRRHA